MHDRNHVLLFEVDPRGHAAEWIRHILRAYGKRRSQEKLTIAVAPALAEALVENDAQDVAWITLSRLEQRVCMSGPIWCRAIAKWAVVRRLAAKVGAGRILLLGLDHLLLPLALGLSFGSRPVTGILFRPTAHYGELLCGDDAASGATGGLKRWMTARALQNRDLCSVLSLDPYFAGYAAREFVNGDRVSSLADPAPVDTSDSEIEADGSVKRDRSQRISMVLFGEITARKGALQLLRALLQTPEPIRRAVQITIAGRVDPPLSRDFYQLVRDLEWVSPESLIRIEDGWISDVDLDGLIATSDVVLAPYQRFVGSSGVLIRAALNRKCVICQDFGLLGRLVRDFKLGLAVDTTDPAKLSQAIEAVVTGAADISGFDARFDAFLVGREPDRFGQQVLDSAYEARVARRKHAGRKLRIPHYVRVWKKWSQVFQRWSHNRPSGS